MGHALDLKQLDRMSVGLDAFYQIEGSWGTSHCPIHHHVSRAWCTETPSKLLWMKGWARTAAAEHSNSTVWRIAVFAAWVPTESAIGRIVYFPLEQKLGSQKSSVKQATLPEALRRLFPVGSCWHAWHIAILFQFGPPPVHGLRISNYLLVSKSLSS